MAWKFTANDQGPDKQSFLEQASVPLFNDWLPYEDVSNCANCCAGRLLLKQSLVEYKSEVVAILFDLKAISELASSSLQLDRCISVTIQNSEVSSKPSVGLNDEFKLVPIDEWLVIRDSLVKQCSN